MGRVEETNETFTELNKTITEALISTTDRFTLIAHVLILQAGTNSEIAKSLAQLADDIHFIKEAIAKEIEGEEKDLEFFPECSDCMFSDTIRYVDKDGILNRDVEWCRRKGQKINFDDRPNCDYFKPIEAE